MDARRLACDLTLLLARLGLGLVLVAHGWQKLSGNGLSGTTASFTDMGVPVPSVSAYVTTFVELLGGAALILGLTVPLVGLLVAGIMTGALVLVHASNGVFVTNNGFELVLVIGLLGLLLAAHGSGRYGIDHLFAGKVRSRRRRTTRPSA